MYGISSCIRAVFVLAFTTAFLPEAVNGGNMPQCTIEPDENGLVVVPEGTTTIDDIGYYQCQELKTIVIASTVTRIGKSAFEFCPGMRPKKFKTIEQNQTTTSVLLCYDLCLLLLFVVFLWA